MRAVRSLLIVPADRPEAFAAALEAGADALVLDLEDTVAPAAKAEARTAAAAFLADLAGRAGRPRLYVRINGLASGLADDDLDAVVAAAPDAVVLPKAAGGRDVTRLDAKLAVREAVAGRPDGGTPILAITGETAASLFAMGSYLGASRRLAGLAWGADDLAAELGAPARTAAGFTDTTRLARCLALAAAAAAGAAPIDAAYPAVHDRDGLAAEAAAAAGDGFTGKIALSPDQVSAINAAFAPSADAVAAAERVLAAFAAAGDAGIVMLDGERIGPARRRAAERLVARAGRR